MVCHYCGKQFPLPETCPVCGSRYLKHFGIGTEQVEEAAAALFPEAVLDRLDLDAVKHRKDLDAILRRFSKGETNILVGTQLVAKGLDFHNVGLVGVIAADVSLNIPDYRSTERTFQLITQVAGRAGAARSAVWWSCRPTTRIITSFAMQCSMTTKAFSRMSAHCGH